MKRAYTLCLLVDDARILLGRKKRGFGAGKWNGFGGKVEEGESLEEAARREMFEESGVAVWKMDAVGVLEFEFVGKPEIMQVHLFAARGYEGEPAESDEMLPRWFDIDDIPYAEMWPDDRYWLPLFLQGNKFDAYFLYGDKEEIIRHEINIR